MIYGMGFVMINSVFLNYNKWFYNKEYRKELSDKLLLPTSEKGINTIWKKSGFDKGELNSEGAQFFKILERWKSYIDKEYYRNLFQDKELIDLSKHFYEPPF